MASYKKMPEPGHGAPGAVELARPSEAAPGPQEAAKAAAGPEIEEAESEAPPKPKRGVSATVVKHASHVPVVAASGCYGIWCHNWCTDWSRWDELMEHAPPRHSDYRDMLPEPLEGLYELYQPVVHEGQWTAGLCQMWFWKMKSIKHSVHIPCWDSFKWMPWKWRGVVCGRSPAECFWTGMRQTRWARGVYAANLGREYVLPVQGMGRHGYMSEIKALSFMVLLMGCIFGCGIGQVLSLFGNLGVNFSAPYTCHAREKMRRRYKLPATFGLPPGIDDCMVHFLCAYCASHQELRELALRGVDGPGMHILDVLPNSYKHLPGHEKVVAERKAIVDEMLKHPPKFFKSRVPKEAPVATAVGAAIGGVIEDLEGAERSASTLNQMGWVCYGERSLQQPQQQEMVRGPPELGRWSVAY